MQPTVKPGKHTFTIVEYGLVVGLVGFFVLAAFLLAQPGERLAKGRDAERQVAVGRIAHALAVKRDFEGHIYLGRESAPAMLLASPMVQVIVTDDSGIVCNDPAKSPSCGPYKLDTSGPNKRCVANLAGLVPTYLDVMPIDPLARQYQRAGLPLGPNNTGYYIRMVPGGRAEIGACHYETTTPVVFENQQQQLVGNSPNDPVVKRESIDGESDIPVPWLTVWFIEKVNDDRTIEATQFLYYSDEDARRAMAIDEKCPGGKVKGLLCEETVDWYARPADRQVLTLSPLLKTFETLGAYVEDADDNEQVLIAGLAKYIDSRKVAGTDGISYPLFHVTLDENGLVTQISEAYIP